MKPPFIMAKSSKLHWTDQLLLMPAACFLCIGLPMIAFFGAGDDWLPRRLPLTAWLLMGIGVLLLMIIDRLGLLIFELQTLTFVCRNLLKDADDPDGSINQFTLNRMRQTIRPALGAPDEDT